MNTVTGLDLLEVNQEQIKGNIAYLCHNASVTKELKPGYMLLKELFGNRVKKIFCPQHGLFGDVQANMIETESFYHEGLSLEVCSLYSETREPTAQMLEGVDTLIVDLQDVGTRIYTYIHTLTLILRKCSGSALRIVVLDRPNPLGGEVIEGNVLDPKFASFVGLTKLPARHGLTIAEVGKFVIESEGLDVDYQVIAMQNWQRKMLWNETGLHWLLPSPNMPDLNSALTFPGTVMLEGTNISEGRGTCLPFQLIGHPDLEWDYYQHLQKICLDLGMQGFTLRPASFMPAFDKHQGMTCAGFQLHINDVQTFTPWKFTQVMLREIMHNSPVELEWLDPPYEYEYEKLPIDILNGSDQIRLWIESNDQFEKLLQIEQQRLQDFSQKAANIKIY